LTDFSVIITLLGVCISYQITFAALLSELPGMILSRSSLTILSGIVLLPLCNVQTIDKLSFASIAALVCLGVAIITILVYGINLYGTEVRNYDATTNSVKLWAEDMKDTMFLVGVSTYCFGLCSAVFPIEESMKRKEDFSKAVAWSLVIVWVIYAVVGDAAAVLYAYDPHGVQDNILRNLPTQSTVANLVRISMAAVCLLSFPLPFVPPTQMLEKLISNAMESLVASMNSSSSPSSSRLAESTVVFKHSTPSRSYQAVIDSEYSHSSNAARTAVFETDIGLESFPSRKESVQISSCGKQWLGLLIRFLFISLCTVVATFLPCFGMVISLLGCFTVTILSFVLPPFFHFQLVSSHSNDVSMYVNDILLTAAGSILCAVSTFMVVSDFVDKFNSGSIVC